jgi:hypothetical protein
VAQLRAKAPGHAMLTALATFESAYDRVSATLKA